MAQPFDDRRGILSGAALPIAQHVALDSSFSLGEFSVSADGKLAYCSVQDQDTVYVISIAGRSILRSFKTPRGAGPDPVLPRGPFLSWRQVAAMTGDQPNVNA